MGKSSGMCSNRHAMQMGVYERYVQTNTYRQFANNTTNQLFQDAAILILVLFGSRQTRAGQN